MLKIAPSILAADVLNLERDVSRVVEGGCDWIHVDVMDAHFVPNLAYTPEIVRRLRERFDVPLDVHLMMDNPKKYMDTFLNAGADVLTIHAEVFCEENCAERTGQTGQINRDNCAELLRHIRRAGAKAGLAIKPNTSEKLILPVLDETDMVLTMTVEPGFGGQKLHEEVIGKIRRLRELGYDGEIEADGGVTAENLPLLVKNGLTVAVMGTAVFHEENPKEFIHKLRTTGHMQIAGDERGMQMEI